MFMGVPYAPFFTATGICLMLAAYINFFYLLLLPVSIFVLRQIAKQDEMIFRLWGRKMEFAWKGRANRDLYPDMVVFTPNAYRRDPPRHQGR